MGLSQSDVDELRRDILLSLHEHWIFYLIEGVILIALGAAAIILPPIATLAVTIIVGWLFLISGNSRPFHDMRGVPGFWWSLISAVLAIVVGVMLIGWPVRGGLLADLAIALFDSGDEVTVEAGEEGIRFLLVSGKPLREPVAW